MGGEKYSSLVQYFEEHQDELIDMAISMIDYFNKYELLGMAKQIREYCAKQNCENCVFGRKLTQANADITVCGISLQPDLWKLEGDEI